MRSFSRSSRKWERPPKRTRCSARSRKPTLRDFVVSGVEIAHQFRIEEIERLSGDTAGVLRVDVWDRLKNYIADAETQFSRQLAGMREQIEAYRAPGIDRRELATMPGLRARPHGFAVRGRHAIPGCPPRAQCERGAARPGARADAGATFPDRRIELPDCVRRRGRRRARHVALGLARQADGGTLFLDEVSDIPLAAQTVLLRFLDSGEIRPVGGRADLRVDVQIVSAANRPLADLVRARLFREDLMFRLNAYTIELPPLRTRTDFAEITRRLLIDLTPQASITEEAIAALSRRPWPGNIRELRHALQRALLRRKGETIDEDCLDESPSADPARSCPSCRASPIDRRFCEEIEAVHRLAGGNIAASLGFPERRFIHICDVERAAGQAISLR
jgi:hypothetical protein